MASGNWTGTTSNSSITPRIVWSSKASNANTNTSEVTVTLQVKKSTASSNTTSGTGAWTVLIDGKTYDFTKYLSIPPNNTYVDVYTKTVTIQHDLDGKKSIVIGWTGGIAGTTYTTTTIADKVVALDTIDRISSITGFSFTNGYIDQGIDFTINAKVTGVYHQVHLYFVDTQSGVGIDFTANNSDRKLGGTYHLNFTAAQLAMFYQAMSSITSSQFTLCVKGYTTQTAGDEGAIGTWQFKTATGNIAASVKPTISNFAVSVNSGGLDGYFVQGKSTAKLTCAATMGNGATVSSYSFSGPNVSASSSSNTATSSTIISSGTLTYKVIVTDSRGRTASAEKQIYVYPYTKPSFKSSMVNRSNSVGTLDSAGTYASYTIEGVYSSVGGKNTRTVTVAHSSNGGQTYSAETTIQAATDLNATKSGVYGSGALSATTSYTIRFTIKDGYGATDTAILSLSTVSRAINIKLDNTGIAFGKIAEGSGIETVWDLTFKGGGQKSLIFENGSSSAWKTQLYQGASSSNIVLGLQDVTNSRSVWSYKNDGIFNMDRTVIFNGGIEYVLITENADLNSMIRPGFYKCPYDATAKTLKNCPAVNAFSLVIEQHAGVKQTLTVYLQQKYPITYVRNYYNNSWGAWSRLCYAGESSVLWTGAVQNGATVTLNESIKNFKFLTCILGDSTSPWGITLASFLDDLVTELHFSAVFTDNNSVAGSNFYGAKFTITNETSLKLLVCGTKNGQGASHLRKIVGWR